MEPDKLALFKKLSVEFLDSFKLLPKVAKLPASLGTPGKRRFPPDKFSFKERMFTSYAGKFPGFFPNRPTKKTFPAQGDAIVSNLITYSRAVEKSIYSVSFYDLFKGVDNEADRELYYSSKRDAARKEFGLKMLRESHFEYDGRSGREYVIVDGNSTTRTRLLLLNKRFYRLEFVSKGVSGRMRKSKDKRFRKAALRFFESFTFSENGFSKNPDDKSSNKRDKK